jgi:GntR family transcriptional regulator
MISSQSKLPLYYQLFQTLMNKILKGELKPGDALPSEHELVVRYGVSRGTARMALGSLAKEGLIHRQQGRGTFVAHPTIQHGAGRMIPFAEDMRQRGFEPTSEVLFAGSIEAPPDVAGRLGVSVGEELVRTERLRLADGEPMTIEESYLVHRLCPGVLHYDYAKESLRRVLRDQYNMFLVRGEQTVRAIEAPPALRNKLQLPAGKRAILHIERVSYSQFDVPVEFLRLFYRGDRYILYNELTGWIPGEK